MPIQIPQQCSGIEFAPILPIVLILVVAIGLLAPVAMLEQTTKGERAGSVFSISKVMRFPGAKEASLCSMLLSIIYSFVCLNPDAVVLWLSVSAEILIVLVILINADPSQGLLKLIAEMHLGFACILFLFEAGLLTAAFATNIWEGYEANWIVALVFFVLFWVAGVLMFTSMYVGVDPVTGKSPYWTSWTSAWEWSYEICFMCVIGTIPGVV